MKRPTVPPRVLRQRRKAQTIRILIGIAIGALLGWLGGVW